MAPHTHLIYDNIETSFGDICIKFVSDHRRIRKYDVLGSNDFDEVLEAINSGIANKDLMITHHNSMYIEVEVHPEVSIFIFLTETDADTLLVTICTNPNIVP